MACIIGKLRPFTAALDGDVVELAVEIKDDYAVDALFALVTVTDRLWSETETLNWVMNEILSLRRKS